MARLSDLVREKNPAATPPPDGSSASVRADAHAAKTENPRRLQGETSNGLPVGGGVSRSRQLDSAEVVLERTADLMEEIDRAVEAEGPLPLPKIQKVQEIVEILRSSVEASDALLLLFYGAEDSAWTRARQAANVCVLSLKIGLALGYSPAELGKLGLAALLSNAWKALVPVEIARKGDRLVPSERAVLETHQREAVAVVEKLAPAHPWLAEVARTRYEKPEGLSNPMTKPEEYAAIVSLADTYESLVHRRPLRARVGPLDMLQELLKEARSNFPDAILRALVRDVSAFPVGSLVRLNTGEIGRVVTRSRDFPLRPVVEIVVRQGKRLESPATIDLREHPLYRIEGSAAEGTRP